MSSLGAIAILMASPAGAIASGSTKPNDPLNAPTFAQQSKDWSPAQFQAYDAKLQKVRDLVHQANGKTGTGVQPYCVNCSPNTFYAFMNVVYEGSADCACGPATITEMFSTLTYYFNTPSTYQTLSQVESQMGFNCNYGTARYQLTNELNGYQTWNNYVWQAVGSAADVHYYTRVDLGLYDTPVGYDGETYGPDGHPLDNYQGVDWKHYFPAYGYTTGYVSVADPHFNYDHQYTDQAVYLFIDNFPYANQVAW